MRTQPAACSILPTATLREAIDALNRGGARIALMVDEAGHLIGTLTDGDMRRSLLRGLDLSGSAAPAVQRRFHAAPVTTAAAEALSPGPTESPSQVGWCGHAGAGFVGTAPVRWPTPLPLLI
ncbi:MAG: CBS domain-containing protein [Cyanobacteria bacterium K_Offshore_surface_m2_239]|nr:CBS domain-containing protein [Cyanobacteria bacterium K_Offshore_surface_m2_239]